MQVLSSRTTSSLQHLPYEMMARIVVYLDVAEIFDLSLCCRQFQYLVREQSFCKAIITAKASYTLEAREAEQTGEFSRALRRVAKRHQALYQASPYVLGIVGLADSYVYIHGILCYIIESRPRRWLRILDLHGSSGCELVIDIPTLIREAVPRAAKNSKYKFRVLYHANGITSCLFSFVSAHRENWLLVFKAEEQQIVTKVQLESTAEIFVRNNKDYLYFGTHSWEDADGFKKWVLTGFRISDASWFPQKIHLTTLIGNDIGSTVCFEIIDDYFYGLSNQTDFEISQMSCTSHYHCFRFSLDNPDPKKIQTMGKYHSWRREHTEGPIDERWVFLKLERDQASGRLHIIESRKEWPARQSGHRRSYYFTKVVFDSDLEVSEEANTIGRPSVNRIGHLDKPAPPRIRDPKNVHQGDESSVAPSFTRRQTHLRSYEQGCGTFFDLVDDRSITSSNSRCLRLRTGYRKRSLKHIPFSFSGSVGGLNHDTSKVNEENGRPHQPNEISFWPPGQKPSNRSPFLDKIYEILNPPGYLGSVDASSDERSLVYTVSEDANGLKVLVYVSFDPAARLAGMLREECILGERVRDGYNPEARAGDITQHFGDYVAEVKGKQKIIGGYPPQALPFYSSDTPSAMHTIMPHPEGSKPWAWWKKAMYQDLVGNKFTFAR
ncbi:hypothetical protein F5Y06DRAFT_305416 [Hypoxylon sp. FL0890]|nr:hypothetical protein F5Y06DRAFT_305416 [Hypoxylon sp. FL0890]